MKLLKVTLFSVLMLGMSLPTLANTLVCKWNNADGSPHEMTFNFNAAKGTVEGDTNHHWHFTDTKIIYNDYVKKIVTISRLDGSMTIEFQDGNGGRTLNGNCSKLQQAF